MNTLSKVLALFVVLAGIAAIWLALREEGPRLSPPTEGPTAREFADAAAQVGLIGSSASGASQQLAEGAGVTLLARVVDDGGAPVAGVEVTVERPQPRRRDRDDAEHELLEVRAGEVQHNIPVATAVSDADGRFRVGGLEPETQYRCTLRPAPPWGWTDRTLRADRPGLHEATYVLERGAALRGRVVDERGEGLQATVIATRDPVDDDVYRTPAWTAAADGRFAVAALPAGTWSFTVSVAGRGRRTGQLVVLPHDGEVLLRFRYPDGPTLMGKVTDVSGRPVAGASVLVRADGTRPEARGRWWALAQTDAQGGYRLEHLDPGLVQGITVEAEGFLTIGDAHRHLLLGASGVVEVDFELARGCTVRGRVVDAAGSPVAGAVVMLDHDMAFSNPSGRPERRSTTSDGEGQYVFERLPPVGHVRLRAYTSDAASGRDGPPLSLAGEARVLEHDLALQVAPVLRGVAVDREGMPVEGVRVEATSYEVHWRHAAGLPRPSTTTDAGGQFELKGVLEGETWSVDAKSESMRMEAPLTVRVPASVGTLEEVRLVLLPAAKVSGRVSDPDGRSLASYHLWMKPLRRGRGSPGAVFTQTNDDGAFVFDQLAAGTYELPRGAFAGDLEGEAAQTFELDWGQAVEGVVVVRRPPLAISGSVFDDENAPLAGVQVRYRAATVDGERSIDRFPMGTTTDENGRFHERVGPGRYSLWAEGGEPVHDVEAGRDDIVLHGQRVPRVEVFGTVVDDRGRPVPRAQVTVWVTSETGGRSGSHASCLGGTFRTSVPATSAQGDLVVSHAADAGGRPLDLAPGGVTNVVLARGPHEIRLSPGGSIAGRVIDQDGVGLGGVAVKATVVRADEVWWTRYVGHYGSPMAITDAEGRFQIAGLAKLAHAVAVDAPGGWLRPAPQNARPGDAPLEMLMERSHELTGRVVDAQGEGVAQAGVTVTWTTASGQSGQAGTSTASDGTFSLAAVGGGPLQVQLKASQSGPWPYKLLTMTGVQPGSAELVLRLESSIALSGVVVKADGTPASRASVWVRGSGLRGGAGTSLLRCDPEGRFMASELEPGSYVLQAMGGERGAVAQEVTVQVPATDVRLQLGRTWPIEGHVASDSSVRYTLYFLYVEGGERKSMGHGSSGSEPFLLWVPTESPGTLWLSVEATGEYALLENVRPGSGTHRLVPKPGLEITGRVEGATRIRPGAHLGASDSRGIQARGEVQVDGTFRIRGLPPGTYTVEAWLEAEQGTARFAATNISSGSTDVVLRPDR